MIQGSKDPINGSLVDSGRELFERFGKAASGFSRDAAVNAAVNVIINALRQEHATRPRAEAAIDELFGKVKQALVNHYDVLGRKRGLFPFDQVIAVPLLDLTKR